MNTILVLGKMGGRAGDGEEQFKKPNAEVKILFNNEDLLLQEIIQSLAQTQKDLKLGAGGGGDSNHLRNVYFLFYSKNSSLLRFKAKIQCSNLKN